MPQPHTPQTDLRKAGLAAALCVGLLLAAGLAVVVLTRRPHAVPPMPGGTQGAPTPEVPPDLAGKGPGTGTARVQFADRSDPARAAGMIEWASLEPVSPTEKLLTEPRGYIYLRGGGLILVSSRSGRLNTTPKVDEPQSGRFEGGVTLKLFPDGTDPKTDQPTLTAASETLDFDIPSASIATTGPFTMHSTAVDLDGSGMRLIVNQVEEGIERFEIAQVKRFLFRPDARDPLAGNKPGTKSAAADKSKASKPDRLRTYRAVIDGAVKISQGGEGRTMTAERVEAWAHLVNNRLAPGAIGRFGPSTAAAASPDSPPAALATPRTPPGDGTISGTWTGRLVVTPVGETGENAQPSEFGENKLALRLHAGQEPVAVHDDAFKGTMTAARVDLGATTRILTLASTPAMPVEITAAGTGNVTARSATVNFGTGRIDLSGGGALNPTAGALARTTPKGAGTPVPAAADAGATSLAFDNTLTLNFATEGDFITPNVKSARITGGFKAHSGEVDASADEATVDFNPPAADTGKATIARIRLNGNAVASAPAATATAPLNIAAPAGPAPAEPRKPGDERDTLKGQQITVNFEPGGAAGHERPRSIEVVGNAEATAGGTGESGLNLKARAINADLGADAQGRLAVVKAEAIDEVHVADNAAGGTPTFVASADRLTVDPSAGVAHLYGSPVTVSRDGAVMCGGHLRLTQATGEAFVDGPGTVSSLKEPDPLKPDDQPSSMLASWQESMTFDNATGKVVCVGDASVTMTIADTERNVLQAGTVLLQLTPAPKPGEKTAAPGQREFISAEAIGHLGVDGKPPRPAVMENRRFDSAGGVQRLQKLTYLEGYRILANQPNRTLDVPVAGKLLVDDRTPGPAPAPGAPAVASPIGGFNSTSGTSLFTWSGSLHLSLADGKAVINRDVALTHQPLPTADQPAPAQTTLDCDTLTAFLKTTGPATGTAGPASLTKIEATLERVEATGNVVAKSDGRQVTANSILYDTVRGFMEAAGKDGTDQPLATFIDPARPAPLRARRFTWNQKTGEMRIVEPAPTTIGP